jgi:radical S-adenosyl methionine domain-containing protein 2
MKDISSPSKIDLLLTTKCSFGCDHCFAPKEKYPELELHQWIDIIQELFKYGTKEIVFSGGEPTSYPHLKELLMFSKDLGIRTTLSTNTDYPLEKYKELLSYVDEIGISLDAVNKETNDRIGRGRMQINTAIELIKEVQTNFKDIEITIRTVVTSINSPEVKQIPAFLGKEGVEWDYIRWKVYEYLPLWRDDDEYIDVLETDLKPILEEIYHHPNLEFFPIRYREPYVIILPNSDVRITDVIDDRLIEEEIGSLTDNGVESILEEINNLETEMPPIRIS